MSGRLGFDPCPCCGDFPGSSSTCALKVGTLVETPPDHGEKTQTEVVWARRAIIWTGQDYPTGNSSRREAKRQTEETMGRQHQRLDWP